MSVHRKLRDQLLLARLRGLAIAVILTAVTACDNVSWGGVELNLRTPPPSSVEAPDSAVETEEAPPPPLELGPALFLVMPGESTDDPQDGSTATMLPVAVLDGEGLSPLPSEDEISDFSSRFRSERMSPDQEFVLFAGGVRAGTFYPSDASGEMSASSPEWCNPRPTTGGRVEILPAAADEESFLALPASRGTRFEYGSYLPTEATPNQRSASLDLAAALYVTMEILWPPSVTRARADVQAFRPPGEDEEMLAATFLYGDSLAVGPAPPNAYSLFFLGEPGPTRYNATYVRYREVGADGKSVARFVNHLDWNRDGRDEVLLEVVGETGKWFATLTRDDSGWREVFEEPCAEAPTPATAVLGPGTERVVPRVASDLPR